MDSLERKGVVSACEGEGGASIFKEALTSKRRAVTTLLTGWGVWIISLVWLFPFVSGRIFVYTSPKPFPVTLPQQSPDFFGRGFQVSLSMSYPVGSIRSLLWMPINGPISINQSGLHLKPFVFGIVPPMVVMGICGWLVAALHRKVQRASVALFASSIVVVQLVLFATSVREVGLSVASSFVAPHAAFTAAMMLGAWIGGVVLRTN